MKLIHLLFWIVAVSPLQADLSRYASLLKADQPGAPLLESGVRVTYLGTNGYLLETRGCTLLVDPYFSREPLVRLALDLSVASNPALVKEGLLAARVCGHVDAILVTHAHVDHLLDAPEVMRETGARLIASRTGVALAESAGVSVAKCQAVTWGDALQVGSARVLVLAAAHDRLFGKIPFPGDRQRRSRVSMASDWVCGQPLAFLVCLGGKRIYIDCGGAPGAPIPRIGPVDLAIVGTALDDSRNRLRPLLAQLRPRYFLPTHQDDFLRPLDRGFSFGTFSNFPEVIRTAAAFPSTLILLDYFRPWTLR